MHRLKERLRVRAAFVRMAAEASGSALLGLGSAASVASLFLFFPSLLNLLI